MLVDSINRYNGTEYLKLVNVENYKAKGVKIPAQIHSVPALLFTENKTVIFGKQVFDYLLLPNKGFLFNLPKKATAETPSQATSGEPMSFSFITNSSDAYSFIEDDKPDPHKNYLWANINDNIAIQTAPEEAKQKGSLPDIGNLKSERDLQLQTFLQTT